MDLALFDFDGTITDTNTFTPFLHFAVAKKRLLLGRLFLAPVIIGYKLGFVHAGVAREVVAGFGFKGCCIEDLQRKGRTYAKEVLPDRIRPEASDRIKWHRERGDQIVVVSASLDVYLRPWCDSHGLDLICSQLEVRAGLITGKYVSGDCFGVEKVRRITARYDISGYDNVYAYGDTDEDQQMLDLANIKYYQWQPLQE